MKKLVQKHTVFFCPASTLIYINMIFGLRNGAPVEEWARNHKFFRTHVLHSCLLYFNSKVMMPIFGTMLESIRI